MKRIGVFLSKREIYEKSFLILVDYRDRDKHLVEDPAGLPVP